MNSKYKNLQVRLTAQQYQQLANIAEKKKMTISDIAREAIDHYNQMDRVEQRLNKLEATIKAEFEQEATKYRETYEAIKSSLIGMRERGDCIIRNVQPTLK